MNFAIYSGAPPKRVPDEDTVQKIIHETGISLVSPSARKILAQDLGRCHRHLQLLHLFDKRSAAFKAEATDRANELNAIIAMPASSVPPGMIEYFRTRRMQADQEALRNDFSCPVSVNDWLVACHMAAIYERAFGRPAGCSNKHKDGRQVVAGPFVRFVIPALAAIGITYSPNSVRTAFKNRKKIEDSERAAAAAAQRYIV